MRKKGGEVCLMLYSSGRRGRREGSRMGKIEFAQLFYFPLPQSRERSPRRPISIYPGTVRRTEEGNEIVRDWLSFHQKMD